MNSLKGILLWIFVALSVAVLMGAMLIVSVVDSRSGSAWNSLLAFFDRQDAVSEIESQNTRKSGRREVARTSARRERIREIEVLQTRLDRKTEQYNLLRAKYDALTALLQNGLPDQKSADEWTNQFADLVYGLKTSNGESETTSEGGTIADATDADSDEQSDEDLRTQLSTVTEKLETAQLLSEIQDEQLELAKQLQETAEENQREVEEELEMLLDEERELQRAASLALISFGSAAVPILSEALEDNRAYVREWAADVFGSLGSNASEAIAALNRAATDPNAQVRLATRQALNAIEDKSNAEKKNEDN